MFKRNCGTGTQPSIKEIKNSTSFQIKLKATAARKSVKLEAVNSTRNKSLTHLGGRVKIPTITSAALPDYYWLNPHGLWVPITKDVRTDFYWPLIIKKAH